MTRRAQYFIDEEFREYLGITWGDREISITNCTAAYAGLQDIGLTGTQSYVDVFSTTLTSGESTLLFRNNASQGLGVWKKPAGGGVFNPAGGQVVLLGFRPYRVNTTQLRNNVEFILDSLFNITSAGHSAHNPWVYSLKQNYPNPFNAGTRIIYELGTQSDVKIEIFTLLGQKVRTLVNRREPTGEYTIAWDARNDAGIPLPSGIYYARISAGDFLRTIKMTLLK